jgi:2-amino-4-hydroxy-6-hydroxymethyldihydropteridine diphosphokinase / dihydropteroate synthase
MIYISLGSNLGDRLSYLEHAVHLLTARYLKNCECSIILETECILPEDAPSDWNKPYLNMVVKAQSDLSPNALLQGLKQIEHEIGRPKIYKRWSPRIIDLDILLWEGVTIQTPLLTIPHPELANRPFLHQLLKELNT